MSNAIVKPQEQNPALKAIHGYLKERAGNIAEYAMGRLNPASLIRLAMFSVANDKQGHLVKCRPESIYASLVLSAQLGLEPSGIRGEAYLVGYGGNCQLIPGYRGLVKLARKSGIVTDLYAHVAYEADVYKVKLGSAPEVIHEPCLSGKRGNLIGTYAVAQLAGSRHPDVEPMTEEDIDDLVNWVKKNRGGKLPQTYQDHYPEMIRKAPLRRISKRIPAGGDFEKAVLADNLAEQGKSAEEVLDVIETTGVEVPDQT